MCDGRLTAVLIAAVLPWRPPGVSTPRGEVYSIARSLPPSATPLLCRPRGGGDPYPPANREDTAYGSRLSLRSAGTTQRHAPSPLPPCRGVAELDIIMISSSRGGPPWSTFWSATWTTTPPA